MKLQKGQTKEVFKKLIESINTVHRIPHQQEAKRLKKVKAKQDIKKSYIGDVKKTSFGEGKEYNVSINCNVKFLYFNKKTEKWEFVDGNKSYKHGFIAKFQGEPNQHNILQATKWHLENFAKKGNTEIDYVNKPIFNGFITTPTATPISDLGQEASIQQVDEMLKRAHPVKLNRNGISYEHEQNEGECVIDILIHRN